MNLRIPGPTPLAPEVIDAIGQQMINHRGPEFEALFGDVTKWLKVFYETENDLFVLTTSGTGGMEAAVVNTLSPGDRVLSVVIGVFGERFAKIAEAYGADVTRLEFEMGQAADPEVVAATLQEGAPFKAVLLTQNETSSAVTNDVASLCDAIRDAADPAPLILVDAISGLGAIRLQTDAWGCDVVVSGSQKAWAAPPGLAMVSFSPKAWEAYEQARMPRYYLDFGLASKYAARNQTPATPNVAALYGLHKSLEAMVAEGPVAIEKRHAEIGAYCRKRALDMALGLFADPDHYSNTVTAVTFEADRSSKEILSALREQHGVICGSSKAPGVEMIRIGHMGYVTIADIDGVFDALASVLGR